MPAQDKKMKKRTATKSKSKGKAGSLNDIPGISQQCPALVPGSAPILTFPNAQTDKMSNLSKILAQSDAQQVSAPGKLVPSEPSKIKSESAQSQQALLKYEEEKVQNANPELEAEFQANNQSEPIAKTARKRRIGEVFSPRSIKPSLDPVGSSGKAAKVKAFEPWLEVQTTFELNAQLRLQLIEILDSYKYDKDRKQAIQHKGDFLSYYEQSRNMDLPNLIWSFELFKYDEYLLELAKIVPKSDNFFSPMVFFQLVFAKATDRQLLKLYDSDATKGFKQLRKNIVDIKHAQICPNCGALAHQMRMDSRHTDECIGNSASHSGLEVPKICNDYVCPLCMRMFRSLSQATLHIATHPWLMLAPFGWNARKLLCRIKNEEDRQACIQLLDLPELMAPETDGKVNRLSRENPGYFLRHFLKRLRYNHSEADLDDHEEQPQLLQSQVSRHCKQEQNYPLSYYANYGNQSMYSLTDLIEGLDIAFDAVNYLPQVDAKYNDLFVGTFGGQVVLHYSSFYLSLIRGGIFQVLCSLNLLMEASKTNKKLQQTYPMLSVRIANGALEVLLDIKADPCLQIDPILHGAKSDKSDKTTYINILQSTKLFTCSYDLYLLLYKAKDLTTTELWRPGHYWEFTRDGKQICLWLGLHCFFHPQDSEEMTSYCTFFVSWADLHKFYEPDEDLSTLLFWQQIGVIGLLLDDPFEKFTWVLGDTTMSSKHTCLRQKDKQFPQLFESFGKLAKKRLKCNKARLATNDNDIEESLKDCARWCQSNARFEVVLSKPHAAKAIKTLLDQTRNGFIELFGWLHKLRHQKFKAKQSGKAKGAQSATLSDIIATLALVVPCTEELDIYTARICRFQIEEVEKRWRVREKADQDDREVDVEKIDEAPKVLFMNAADEKKQKKS